MSRKKSAAAIDYSAKADYNSSKNIGNHRKKDLMNYRNRTWTEIDLGKAADNFRAIRARAGDRAIFAVVKANAYGHGAVRLSALYEKLGVEGLAVSGLGEALQLREAGIQAPILILGYTPCEHAEDLIREKIMQAVYSLDYARHLNEYAEKAGGKVSCQIKLDTGMGRIGFSCREGLDEAARAELSSCRSLGHLDFCGVFTHYAVADSDDPDDEAFSDRQYDGFCRGVSALTEMGYRFRYIHCDNSAATLTRDDTVTNTVRPGIVLYGYRPDPAIPYDIELKPVMSIKSVVSHVKTVMPGDSVGYGRAFIADRVTRVATVPVGYADGYPRCLSGKGEMLIRGHRVPILGRVCMDQCMVDVSELPEVAIGDVVTLLGADGKEIITAEDIAEKAGTNSYEILCGLAPRVEVMYVE